MGYVPGFENDVFISYGHIDNSPPSEGWVTSLHEYVLGQLRIICSPDVTVWRDARLDEQAYLKPEVRKAVASSAIFISVLSPGFAQKEWCAREAEWFLESQARDGICVEGKSRVVRAVKWPLPPVPWPKALDTETLHFKFYSTDEQSMRVTGFSPHEDEEEIRQRFKETCDNMTQCICGLLRRIRLMAMRDVPSTPSQKTIFLADVTRDVRELRQSLLTELADRNIGILTADFAPEIDQQKWEARIAAVIDRADIAVHLLGSRYGVIPEGMNESVIEAQFRIAQERGRDRPAARPLLQVVWLPDNISIVEPRQGEFVDRLKAGAGISEVRGFEFTTSRLQTFKDELLDIAARKTQEAAPPGATRSVYLLCNRRDQLDRDLQSLKTWLLDNGFPADMPAQQGDAASLQQLEEASIVEYDATVIFYGTAEDSWVRQKRRAIQKAWAKPGVLEARRSRAVYLAKPEGDEKQAQYRSLRNRLLREPDRFSPLIVLGDCSEFDPNHLNPLLTSFTGSSGTDESPS